MAIPKRKTKVGSQHIVTYTVLMVVFFCIFQFWVIPYGVAGFVLPLFQPSGEKLEKMGFVKFKELVWASTTKEKEKTIVPGETEVKAELINRDYVFDFTFEERTMEKDGYVKKGGFSLDAEFYAKSEILGENPIYLEPWRGFTFLSIVFSFVLTTLLTILFPKNIGLMALLFDRQISDTKIKIRLQTGFSDDVVSILTMPDDLLMGKEIREIERAFRIIWERTTSEEMSSSKQSLSFDDIFDDNMDIVKFRNEVVYGRIKEFFSGFVVKEIKDTKDGYRWRRNQLLMMDGFRLYMTHHFTEKYSNFVTGLAYGGAALLIVAVGIRGLKFIPAQRPSWILLAISLEFSMLALLAITLIITEEEERMDRMLKKMEDANRSQLEALREQQHDIRLLANALVGQTAEIIKARVEKSISEYMMSDDNIKRVVAEEIGEQIFRGLKDAFSEPSGAKEYDVRKKS